MASLAIGKPPSKRNDNVGVQCEVRSLQRRYKKGKVEIIATDEYQAADFDESVAYALVSTQKFSKEDKLKKTLLRINSPQLLSVLRKVVVSHPNVPSGFDSPFTIESPFIALFHHWDGLEAYKEIVEDDLERVHLGLLLNYMEAEMGKQRKEVRGMIQNGSIDFLTLWTIYKPGELIYAEETGFPYLMKLEKTVYEESNTTGRRFEIHCRHTINDGQDIVPRSHTIIVYEKRSFGGGTPAKIESIEAYPLSCRKSRPGLLEELEERGRRSQKLVGVLNMRYEGRAMYQRLPPRSYWYPDAAYYENIWLPCYETARVVIDNETYLKEDAYEARKLAKHWSEEFLEWTKKHFDSPEIAKLVLCAPFAFGYSLQQKRWNKYYVESLDRIEWKDDAINSLVLSQRQKALVTALVNAHEYPENARETAEQKGKGLVILLHGDPGSGKTLTAGRRIPWKITALPKLTEAEVSAESKHAGLLPISLGELYDGDNLDEDLLKKLLQYATIWRAIVLLDEADVFLEARTSGSNASSQRNALVAVFLKYLEYFAGIVFLTSNKVEDFDNAMKSRIHLALQYDPPASEVRRQIWTKRLSAIPAEENGIDVPTAVESLIKNDMNGREIANAINTARTLARHSKAKLDVSHLSTVIEVWREFDISLGKLKRKRAVEGRQDSFVESVKRRSVDQTKWETPA